MSIAWTFVHATDGDWGAHSEGTFRAALAEARQDRDAMGTTLYALAAMNCPTFAVTSGSQSYEALRPFVQGVIGTCAVNIRWGLASGCGGGVAHRLCKCL
jgi:hypothetical protein